MRLAFITTDFPPMPGGIAALFAGLACSCTEHCEVTVLAPQTPGAEQFDGRQPYRIIRVPGPPAVREAWVLRHLVRLDRSGALDLIVCGSWFTPGAVAWLMHVSRKKPYIVWTYGSEIADDWLTFRRAVKSLLRPLKIPVLERCAAIVAISRFTKALVVAQGISSEKIHVIPPGVDPSRFSPSGDSLAVARYRKGATHVLLTVARLDPHKGHTTVLKALAADLRDLDGLRYLIVGSGPERSALGALASSLGVTAKVEFLGHVPDDDLPILYRAADVFVMPSKVLEGRLDYVEGFGISYLEASASQKPIVAGRGGGVEDAVVDGVTGVLVNPDDVSEIGRALRGLLLDPTRAERLGRAGRERVVSQLTLDHFARHVLDLARSTVGTPSS